MASFSFFQRCLPEGKIRIGETTGFLKLGVSSFDATGLYLSTGKPVEVREESLRELFEERISQERFPSLGAAVHFFTAPPKERSPSTIRFEVHTGIGPDEPFAETFDIAIGDPSKLPAWSFFVDCIRVVRPVEAFLAEASNEKRLGTFKKQQSISRFVRPAAIRGLHFFGERIVTELGGVQRCLGAPAHDVKRVDSGVLVYLVEGIFNPEDRKHLAAQQAAMDYFGIR